MIILFSNCGFAIIAFLFYLCGSNRVADDSRYPVRCFG